MDREETIHASSMLEQEDPCRVFSHNWRALNLRLTASPQHRPLLFCGPWRCKSVKSLAVLRTESSASHLSDWLCCVRVRLGPSPLAQSCLLTTALAPRALCACKREIVPSPEEIADKELRDLQTKSVPDSDCLSGLDSINADNGSLLQTRAVFQVIISVTVSSVQASHAAMGVIFGVNFS